jgi:tripartite ATP-independent transporter DctP family solute receptor
MIEQTQLGTLDCTCSATAFLSGAYPPVAALGLPFLFPDDGDSLRAILKHGKATKFMRDDLSTVGFKGAAFHTVGFKQFTNSKKPITKLEDFKGIKFRAMASPILLAQFKALGANAIPIPFPEVYNALQTGLADGQENPYWFIYQMKIYEVQKYLSVSNHAQIALYNLLSKKFWNKLSPDLKKIVDDAFIEGEKINWDVARKIDKKAIEGLKKGGLKFFNILPKERERLRQATINVKEAYFKRVGDKGRKIFAMLQEDIKKYSK